MRTVKRKLTCNSCGSGFINITLPKKPFCVVCGGSDIERGPYLPKIKTPGIYAQGFTMRTNISALERRLRPFYHILQLQYLALVISRASLHLCLARKLRRLSGSFRLILTPLCPNRTFLTRPVWGSRTYTTNFFAPVRAYWGRFSLGVPAMNIYLRLVCFFDDFSEAQKITGFFLIAPIGPACIFLLIRPAA